MTLFNKLLKAVNLCAAEFSIALDADWIKPKLGFVFVTIDMYMKRLISIACVAEESILKSTQPTTIARLRSKFPFG